MSTFDDKNTHLSNSDLNQNQDILEKTSETSSLNNLDLQFLPSHIHQILLEQNRPAIQAEKLDEYFKNLTFFEKLRQDGGYQINDLLLHEVWRNVEFTKLEANTIIFKEKEPSNNKMFIILKGKVGINIKPLQEELFTQGNEKNEQQPNSKQQKNNSKTKESNENQNSLQNTERNDLQTSTPQKQGQSVFKLDQQRLDDDDENNQQEQSDSESEQETVQSEQQENNPFPLLGRKVAELDSGKAFGEQALFKEGGFRNASVYTLEQTCFLVVWRDKFLGVLSVLEQIKQDKIQRIGRVLPFFDDIVSSQLKDRLVYLFEDVNFSKGTILTQENIKGSYIYVLRSGRVALEKSITLEEYKVKESQEVKRQTFQHRFSEFTTAELIGDEVLEEKSKIYFHKKNLRPSEYMFTSIVLSSEAQFLRLDKKKVIDGFPKYIVEQLRENMIAKKKMRQKIIEDYVQRIQPNFVEYQKKDISMKKTLVKKFKISNNIVGHLLGENTPLSQSSSPSKKVQFQNIVRNSILPLTKNQQNYSLEANKTLIQDLQVIKLKRQKSNSTKKDGDTPINIDSQKNYMQLINQNSYTDIKKGLNLTNKQSPLSIQTSSSFSNHFTGRQQNSSNQKEDINNMNNIHESLTSRSQFSKCKTANSQQNSLTDHDGLSEGQNYILPKGYNSISNLNNYSSKNSNNNYNNQSGSINDLQLIQQEYFSSQKKSSKLRLSQSIPSLVNVNKIANSEQKPNPNFFYNHAENLKSQQKKERLELKKLENEQKKNLQNSQRKSAQYPQPEKQKIEPLSEEQNIKIQKFKQKHISQFQKKIDCEIMKKEIIYQHMVSLKEQSQINPFDDENSKRQKQIQKEIMGIIQRAYKQAQENISQTKQKTNSNKQNKIEESKLQSLKPILETKHEELTSKQYININNQNSTLESVSLSELSNNQSNETVTQTTKLTIKPDSKKNVKFLTDVSISSSTHQGLTSRSKTSLKQESISLLNEEGDTTNIIQHSSSSEEEGDSIQKKISALQGKDKKKFYMLQETWDFGIENLKMKELDLRNDLQRKGIIHKLPLEQTNKDVFEKLDQHQLNIFKKYLKKKNKQLQKEKKQIGSLFRMIQPEIKVQDSTNSCEVKSKLNLDLQIVQNEGQSNNTQQISITERSINENTGNQSMDLMQNQQQKIQSLTHLSKSVVGSNNLSENIITQQIKPSQDVQQKLKQQNQVSYSNVQLSLPYISPSKKISQKHILPLNLVGEIYNNNYEGSKKVKTEGDLEQEFTNHLSQKAKNNKQIYSPEKNLSSSLLLELSPLQNRFQGSQSSTNLNQYTNNNQRQFIAVNTDRLSKEQKSTSLINQQLPHIVYGHINQYKNKPSQDSQILSNRSKQIKQIQQLEFTKKELQKISSVSNMVTPNRNKNEIQKEQFFLSPQSAKLLQKF